MARNTNQEIANLADMICGVLNENTKKIMEHLEELTAALGDTANDAITEASFDLKIHSTLCLEWKKISTKYRNKH